MAIDLTGQTFGKWTVLEMNESSPRGDRHWWCRCVCGSRVSVRGKSLRLGRSKQCARCNYNTPRTAESLIGRVFGKWTVIGEAPHASGGVYWLCRCDCGTTRPVRGGSLRAGLSSSCGVCNRKKKAEVQRRPEYEATTGHLVTCLAVAGGAPDPDCPCNRDEE